MPINSRQERRQRQREAEKASTREGAPPKPEAGQVVIRTVYVCTPDMVQQFAQLLNAKNPLAGMVHREVQQVHRLPAHTPIQLAGFLLNVREVLSGDGVEPPKRSNLILPGQFRG